MSAVTGPSGPEMTPAGPYAPARGPLSGVQLPLTEQTGAGRQRLESLAIFIIFGVAYGLLGYWLVVDQKVVTFDSLERLSNAYSAWHNTPPKLAAIGFALPPLQSMVLLPFTLISSMATSLVALPIASAIFGGLTMVAFNRLLDRCDFPPVLRYPFLILIGLTPTLAFYSAGGGAEMISMFLLTGAVSSLIAWFRTVDTRFLITSGIAFSFAVMADYSNFIYLLLAGAMVATVLARHGADDAEVEGSLITYVAPAFYAIALWCLINWLIVSSPFGWIDDVSQATVNISASHLPAHSASLVRAFADSLRLALNAAPLSLVIAPALIAAAVIQRNELAAWLAAFTIVAIFRPGAEAVLHSNIADLQMNLSAPQILMAVAGAAWLYQSFPDARNLIAGGIAIGLVATLVIVWNGTNSYPYQNMEQAFHKAIATSGTKPTQSIGGLSVGVTQEQQMADYIRAHVHGADAVIADNSQTYAVVLLSKEPKLFRTRLNTGGSTSWLNAVKVPPKGAQYFLIAYNDPNDAIRKSYPNAVNGTASGLDVVFKDSRYALVSIAKGTTQKTVTTKPKKTVIVPDQIDPTVDTQ